MRRALPAIALAGIAATTLAAQTFTSRVDGVRIDVLVTDHGRAVTGLQASDFEVRDNGVLQAVTLVGAGDVPVSTVLTLDASASLAAPRLAALKRAGVALLDRLVPGDAAALLIFNTLVARQVAMTTDLDAVRQALSEVSTAAETSLVDAAVAALLVGESDAGRTLVVVFSDGVDTTSFLSAQSALATARRANSVVYGVWSGAGRSTFLRQLADATGGRVVEIGDDGDPGPAFVAILQEFRQRYVVTFVPDTPAAGWHALDVRVKRPGARVQARAGYFGGMTAAPR